jgi:NTP pyrophosphatase (non-canonical NTP hydrolase)
MSYQLKDLLEKLCREKLAYDQCYDDDDFHLSTLLGTVNDIVKIYSKETEKGGMRLNEVRDKAFDYAKKQGFHKKINIGEKLMLIVSELSEAMEADRNGKYCIDPVLMNGNKLVGYDPEKVKVLAYNQAVKGTVEEEIADAIIRICDLAGILKIDLDWHVRAKMAYNETRPYKHGKKY